MPFNYKKMREEIYKIISDKEKWNEYSKNGLEGIEKYYSWKSHVNIYLNYICRIIQEKYYNMNIIQTSRKRLAFADRLIITDIDNILIGDIPSLDRFKNILNNRKENIAFASATGRTIESTNYIIDELKIPKHDIYITSTGTEIYYNYV